MSLENKARLVLRATLELVVEARRGYKGRFMLYEAAGKIIGIGPGISYNSDGPTHHVNNETLLSFISQYKRVVTLEEHSLEGGLGSLVSELLTDRGVKLPVKRFGIADRCCLRYGNREWMQSFYGIDSGSVIKGILEDAI